jgi:hypothetical protein
MTKRAITTPKAKAIGPYSMAIEAGDLVFLSGQIPLDAATGKLVEGDIAAQTRQSLENLKTILEAAGLGFGHGQDHHLPDEHGRFRRRQRGLQGLCRRALSGALDHRRGGPADGGESRN